ncbi:MAG: Hsp33 family molecular chaperone HslO [Acidobacteriota bacterium]
MSETPGGGRDGTLRLGVAAGGALRWAAVDLTPVVEEARGRLDLSPVAAAALGRCLSGAALLLRLAVKNAARLVLEVRGDGPLRRVIAEVDEAGNLRGMVGNPHVDLPPTPAGKLDVGGAVGRGFLRVLREHDGGSYESQVALQTGEIGDDVAHYLEQSEQTRSVVLLGVLTRPFGIAAAGGMIVEAMPDAPGETIGQLERNLGGLAGISRALEEHGLEGVQARVLDGLAAEDREAQPLRYRCRCSRERLRRHMALLAPEDREHLRREDGSIEAECVFCGEVYRFAASDIQPA